MPANLRLQSFLLGEFSQRGAGLDAPLFAADPCAQPSGYRTGFFRMPTSQPILSLTRTGDLA